MSAPDRSMLKLAGATVSLVSGGLVVAVPTAQANTFTATDFASLQAAIANANATLGTDTITIPAGTIQIGPGSLPEITESVIINGAGMASTVIDGMDNYSIFYISTGVESVTISNLTITRASSGRYEGTAIYSADGDLTLDSVTVSDSYAQRDGIILFTRNAGTHGNLVISDSVFTGNRSGSAGGVIYADFFYADDVTITDSTFSDNTSSSDGGAMYIVDAGDVSITNTTFDGNRAGSDGGALFVDGAVSVTVTDSTFVDNSTSSGGGAGWIGSAGVVTITGSSFTDSYGGGDGGALYLHGDAQTVSIVDTDFTSNFSGDNGGALNGYELQSLQIVDSSFVANGSSNAGGALYLDYVYEGTTIENSVFSGNYIQSSSGGAIFTDSSLTVEGSVFEDNVAYYAGGAIYANSAVVGGSTITIRNSTFSANSAGAGGGAVSIYGEGSGNEHVIEQSTFHGNVADADGDGEGRGGALAFWSYTAVTLVNSTIAGNSAAMSGGVHVGDGDMYLTMHNTIIGDNTDDSGDNDLGGVEAVEVVGNHNLVEVIEEAPVIGSLALEVTLTGTGNVLGVDPMLGALGDNGGNTETMVPMIGSPALDAGDNSVSPGATDQRGAARIYKSTIDIGAVEATAEERGESLPPTGSGAERAAWFAALLSGVGAVLTLGASRRRQQQG